MTPRRLTLRELHQLRAAGLTRKQACWLAFTRWRLNRDGHGANPLMTPDMLRTRERTR